MNCIWGLDSCSAGFKIGGGGVTFQCSLPARLIIVSANEGYRGSFDRERSTSSFRGGRGGRDDGPPRLYRGRRRGRGRGLYNKDGGEDSDGYKSRKSRDDDIARWILAGGFHICGFVLVAMWF